jgi:chromosome transmission fidelity protein 1
VGVPIEERNRQVYQEVVFIGARRASRSATVATIHRIQAFLLALANADVDGRVLISCDRSMQPRSVTLKYLLLNPAHHFREVVDDARSVVLAGGTLAPVGDIFSWNDPL